MLTIIFLDMYFVSYGQKLSNCKHSVSHTCNLHMIKDQSIYSIPSDQFLLKGDVYFHTANHGLFHQKFGFVHASLFSLGAYSCLFCCYNK